MTCFNFDFFRNKSIGLFGIGKSNLDILSNLPEGCRVTVRSEFPLPSLPSSKAKITATYIGENAFKDPREDLLILSPSVRRDRKELIAFRRAGVKLTSDHELFFKNVTVPVFAVTGSDGKSTVTSLVAGLLSEKFSGARAIGNIGVPMLSSLTEKSDAYAAELSSFMLSYGQYRVFRGCVTNITENHLNWHKRFEEYLSVKLSLFKRSEECILNADDPLTSNYFKSTSPWGVISTVLPYRELKHRFHAQAFYTLEDGYIKRCGEPIINLQKVKRREKHNLQNLTIALAMTDGYVSRDHMQRVAREFNGLEHRSELFLSYKGMDFINSSIDSTPARTISTLESLGRKVIIILGGKGKNLSYEPLKEVLAKWAELAILCGENREEIERAIEGVCKTVKANDPEDAARLALSLMKSGDTLLLSPASTSFDRYKDFEERGKKFKEIINSVLAK